MCCRITRIYDKKRPVTGKRNSEKEKMSKWFTKLLCKLLNITALNAKIIYICNIQRKVSHLKFKFNLVQELVRLWAKNHGVCLVISQTEQTVIRQHEDESSKTTSVTLSRRITLTERIAKPQQSAVHKNMGKA